MKLATSRFYLATSQGRIATLGLAVTLLLTTLLVLTACTQDSPTEPAPEFITDDKSGQPDTTDPGFDGLWYLAATIEMSHIAGSWSFDTIQQATWLVPELLLRIQGSEFSLIEYLGPEIGMQTTPWDIQILLDGRWLEAGKDTLLVVRDKNRMIASSIIRREDPLAPQYKSVWERYFGIFPPDQWGIKGPPKPPKPPPPDTNLIEPEWPVD
jgi:hypothetical protein